MESEPRTSRRARSRRRGSFFTLRARLTIAFAALFSVAGAALLGGLYAFAVGIPSYLVDVPASESLSTNPQSSDTADPGSELGRGFWTEVLPDGGVICPDGVAEGSAECVDFSGGDYFAGPTDSDEEWLYFDDPDQLLLRFLLTGALALAALIALSTAASWFVVGRILRPLRRLRDAAHAAARGDFDHRVALTGRRDEVVELAETFDDMLARLQRFVRDQRHVAAQASHELKGPLATTQLLLENGTDRDMTPDELAELLSKLRSSNERSITLIESVLELAELSLIDVIGEPVDVAALLDSVHLRLAPVAESARVDVLIESAPGNVFGDPILLEQAVLNLLGNAVKHNRPGGTVWVRTGISAPPSADSRGPSAHQIAIEIENTGRQLDSDELALLAHPFYRDSRSVRDSHGLGLPFVESVAGSHGGSLSLTARVGGGLIAELRLPEARP